MRSWNSAARSATMRLMRATAPLRFSARWATSARAWSDGRLMAAATSTGTSTTASWRVITEVDRRRRKRWALLVVGVGITGALRPGTADRCLSDGRAPDVRATGRCPGNAEASAAGGERGAAGGIEDGGAAMGRGGVTDENGAHERRIG